MNKARLLSIGIWNEVCALVGRRKRFHTLGRSRDFEVVRVLPSALVMKVGAGTVIQESRKDFEKVWKSLLQKGKFDLMDIRDRRDLFPFNRPAYIPAILSELDFIGVHKERGRTGIQIVTG